MALCTVLCLVAQLCPTLCNPMDCSLPGSSVRGDSPSKNTGMGSHFLLQGIFSTQGSNPGLPRCRQILYQLSHLPMQKTQEMQILSLGREDRLVKEMATYSSILAWEIPWTEETGGLKSMGLRRARPDGAPTHFLALEKRVAWWVVKKNK